MTEDVFLSAVEPAGPVQYYTFRVECDPGNGSLRFTPGLAWKEAVLRATDEARAGRWQTVRVVREQDGVSMMTAGGPPQDDPP